MHFLVTIPSWRFFSHLWGKATSRNQDIQTCGLPRQANMGHSIQGEFLPSRKYHQAVMVTQDLAGQYGKDSCF